jgi:hypothetical protein
MLASRSAASARSQAEESSTISPPSSRVLVTTGRPLGAFSSDFCSHRRFFPNEGKPPDTIWDTTFPLTIGGATESLRLTPS